MQIIIDGYNLIFAWGWLQNAHHSSALEKSRRRLIRELGQRIPVAERGSVTIVFDAKNRPLKDATSKSLVDGFHIVFADEYDEADSLIEEMIRTHSNPKSLTVVSSDNRLKTAATRRKASAIDSAAWLDEMEHRFTQIVPGQKKANDPAQPNAKEQAMRDLANTDWIAEFELADQQSVSHSDQPTAPPDTPTDKPTEIYDPFPPGYGEDLLE